MKLARRKRRGVLLLQVKIKEKAKIFQPTLILYFLCFLVLIIHE